MSFGYFPHFLSHETKIEKMGHTLFSCVGGMEHVALHQREKNFSCPTPLKNERSNLKSFGNKYSSAKSIRRWKILPAKIFIGKKF